MASGKLWNDSVWLNSGKYLDIYDENNNLIEELGQSWNGSVWVNGYKYHAHMMTTIT